VNTAGSAWLITCITKTHSHMTFRRQRRRSGRLGKCHRCSFETVRLPTGAFADVFASHISPTAAAAATHEGLAPPQQQPGNGAASPAAAMRSEPMPTFSAAAVAAAASASKTAPGSLDSSGFTSANKVVASLSLKRPQLGDRVSPAAAGESVLLGSSNAGGAGGSSGSSGGVWPTNGVKMFGQLTMMRSRMGV